MTMTPKEEAVVEAAKACRRIHDLDPIEAYDCECAKKLYYAVDALLESEKPTPSVPAAEVTVEECVGVLQQVDTHSYNGTIPLGILVQVRKLLARITPPLEPCAASQAKAKYFRAATDYIRADCAYPPMVMMRLSGESESEFGRRWNAANAAIRAEREAAHGK